MNATTTKTVTGFTLPCPCCGADEVGIAIRLADLEGEAFRCDECETDFSAEFVRNLIGRWTKVLAWLDNVPQFDTDEE